MLQTNTQTQTQNCLRDVNAVIYITKLWWGKIKDEPNFDARNEIKTKKCTQLPQKMNTQNT